MSVGSIYNVILYPYLFNFSSFNNIIFRTCNFLLAFVGNKFDQASTAKRSKKEVKFQGIGHTIAYCQHDGLAVSILQVWATNQGLVTASRRYGDRPSALR